MLILFLSNSNSLHVSKSQPGNKNVHEHNIHAHCTHAQGTRDSAAVVITPNSSIRRTVMINPVESLLLPSVTCQATASPPALPAVTDRRSTGATMAPVAPVAPGLHCLYNDTIMGFKLIFLCWIVLYIWRSERKPSILTVPL